MSKRSKMFASVIREIIAPDLALAPPECGIVSITEVEVSPDNSHATVFLSSIENQEVALAFFENRRRELQKRLSKLARKRVPTLRFQIDPRPERGARIDSLLKDI